MYLVGERARWGGVCRWSGSEGEARGHHPRHTSRSRTDSWVLVQEYKKFICQVDIPFPYLGPNMGMIFRAVVINDALVIWMVL